MKRATLGVNERSKARAPWRLLLPLMALALLLVPLVHAQPPTNLWFIVLERTEAYNAEGELMFTAEPGQWFRAVIIEDGWLLAVRDQDPPSNTVWILLDSRIDFVQAALVSTPTPTATRTSPPTATPSPSPEPADTPTPAGPPVPCQPRMSETEYVSGLRLQSGRLVESLERVGRLIRMPVVTSATWRAPVRDELRAQQSLIAEGSRLCPPTRNEASYWQFNDALELADTAASNILSAFDLIERAQQIESSLVDRATGLIGEGNRRMEEAIPLIREAQTILNRELTAEATRTPAATSAPTSTATPQPTRADGVVGDQIATCSFFDVPFDVTAIGGTELPDDWIAVIVRATNTGLRSEDLFRAARIRDERERLFDMRSASDHGRYADVLGDIRARGMTVGPYNETIQPGRTAVVVLMFQVAPDSRDLTLVPDSVGCLRTEPTS